MVYFYQSFGISTRKEKEWGLNRKHFSKINKLGRYIHLRITQVYLVALANPSILHRTFALL